MYLLWMKCIESFTNIVMSFYYYVFFVLRRLHHIVSFFTKNPQVSTFLAEVMPHHFLFRQQSLSQHFCLLRLCHTTSFFTPNRMARGQGYCLKRNPMCFFMLQKGSQMEARECIQPPMTQLQCFIPFYSEIWYLVVLLACYCPYYAHEWKPSLFVQELWPSHSQAIFSHSHPWGNWLGWVSHTILGNKPMKPNWSWSKPSHGNTSYRSLVAHHCQYFVMLEDSGTNSFSIHTCVSDELIGASSSL